MDAALWRRGFRSRTGCRPSFDERDACSLHQGIDSPDIETCGIRGLRLSVALEVARRDASDLTRGLRAQAGWILNPAESLDAEPGPGLPRHKVTVGAPEAPADPAGWPRRKLLDLSGPAPVADDAPRARWRRMLVGHSTEPDR